MAPAGRRARCRVCAGASRPPVFMALEATAWVVEYLPEIRSYLDAPKSLEELQSESRLRLEALLDHEDRFVRYYAAQKLLGIIPECARSVIEWNYKYWFDAIAGDARGLLRAFDTGAYRPD